MTDNELIANLTREIAELKEINKDYKDVLGYIKSRLISIGAPLNDNVLKYNKKQLKLFWDILQNIKNVLFV